MDTANPAQSGQSVRLTLRTVTPCYGTLFLYALSVGAIYAGLILGFYLLENPFQNQIGLVMMGGWVLWLPLLASYVIYQEKAMLGKKPRVSEALQAMLDKFLALFGTLLALILIPAGLVGLGVFAIIGAHYYEQPQLDWGIIFVCLLLIVLYLNTRLPGLLITLFSTEMTDSALYHAKEISRGFYGQIFLRSTLPFLGLILLLCGPLWLLPWLPSDPLTQSVAVLALALIFAFVSPFLWGMMIVQLHALEYAYLKKSPQKKKASAASVKQAPKSPPKEEDYF